ncbi:major facilitator superfamily domain-containing protein [Aspergillus pseudoustus]|uniref:Major facilitator superfamily domain-containing protein n=1 Tax=Aspergillus pseudoustus TaxID=1810923 RepID=A0ABR4ILL9_9EURO
MDIEKGPRSITYAPGVPPTHPQYDAHSAIEYLHPKSHSSVHVPQYNKTTRPSPPKIQPFSSPLLWSARQKSITTIIACGVTAMAAYAAGECAPAFDQLQEAWGVDRVPYNLSTTLFTLGFAVTPMVLAPFSEGWGRRPIFLGSGVLFTVCLAGCGASSSLAGLLVGRFFLGVSGSSFSSIVGGVISDIYADHERNVPMAIFSGATLFGTGIGPLVSSIIASRITWRWICYSQAIASAVFVALLYFFFAETREAVLLSRMADELNGYFNKMEQAGNYGVFVGFRGPQEGGRFARVRYRVDTGGQEMALSDKLLVSCSRPFVFLFTEPVVFFFSLWVAFSWAVLYLNFGSIPLVFSTSYGFTLEQTGAIFTVIAVASILASLLSIYQEKLAKTHNLLPPTVEARLYFACLEAILLPIGLFWFGWTAQPSIHWIVPSLGIGCAIVGIFSIYLATFNYLADAYGEFASSAIAAQSFCRNLLGGIFPLVTNAMFSNLGYGPAASLLGGIGLALTLVPYVLVAYGPRIRAKSKFTSKDSDSE